MKKCKRGLNTEKKREIKGKKNGTLILDTDNGGRSTFDILATFGCLLMSVSFFFIFFSLVTFCRKVIGYKANWYKKNLFEDYYLTESTDNPIPKPKPINLSFLDLFFFLPFLVWTDHRLNKLFNTFLIFCKQIILLQKKIQIDKPFWLIFYILSIMKISSFMKQSRNKPNRPWTRT